MNLESETLLVGDEAKKTKKKSYTVRNNSYLSPDLVDSPIYNEDMMDDIRNGIVQNIYVEMDRQGLTTRGLGELSGVNYSHLSRMFSGQAQIGLESVIKLSYALRVSPKDLFPYDTNCRKTDGQRFDEMTKDMDTTSRNVLLGIVADFVKECRRIKRDA
jgi:transcriptional regulator with XRE-family HTH domain